MKVQLVSVTKAENALSPDELMAYCARVSSPQNQETTSTMPKLLNYCMQHGHWSVFEMATMCVYIETSRAVAQQILRHKSFSFQEFSQRYSTAMEGVELSRARRQASSNRQSSMDDLPDEVQEWWYAAQAENDRQSRLLYEEALRKGIARECARFLLPLATKTRMYMAGPVRSWIHYLRSRLHTDTQSEHREIARAIWGIFQREFPVTADAMQLL